MAGRQGGRGVGHEGRDRVPRLCTPHTQLPIFDIYTYTYRMLTPEILSLLAETEDPLLASAIHLLLVRPATPPYTPMEQKALDLIRRMVEERRAI